LTARRFGRVNALSTSIRELNWPEAEDAELPLSDVDARKDDAGGISHSLLFLSDSASVIY